jgi:hypothetical protein
MSRQLIATLVILACGLLPARLGGDGPSRLLDNLKSNMLNRIDLERIEQGYYDKLLETSRRLDDLADLPDLRIARRQGRTWSVPFDDAPLVMRVDDMREVVLRANDADIRQGVLWHTNSLGMRDRTYSVEKPPRTFRILLVGDSIGAGWGVDVEDRFESILEELWDSRARKASGWGVEIINCAVPGHSPGQRWRHFTQVGWPMKPDLVISESTAADVGWDERRLRYLLARGLAWDSPVYRAVLEQAGLERLLSPDDYRRALRPRHWEILAGVYQTMAAECSERGVPIVWVVIPRVGRKSEIADQPVLCETARAAGFSRIVDATDAFDGVDPARLALDPHDFHPNAMGHLRLARRLDLAMRELPELGWLWSTDQGHASSGERATSHERSTGARARAAAEVPLDERVGEPQ